MTKIREAIKHIAATRSPRQGDLIGKCESREFAERLLKELNLEGEEDYKK